MCDRIIKHDGKDIGTIRQFQEEFKVDAEKYGWDGNNAFIDCCICDIDLKAFFKDNPQLHFIYESGEWWED